MRVFISGATGLVGSYLCLALRREGHQVVAFVRNEEKARASLGSEVELLSTRCADEKLSAVINSCDAVVNLAGAPVAQRWTSSVKKQIRESRVDLTERLVAAMREGGPKTFVSASAVGIYGDRGDETLDAESSADSGWLAQICVDWEAAAQKAADHGARVALLRIGIVLANHGGALAKMLPAFELGVGGRLGSGKQWMPWIHLDDLVGLIQHALIDDSVEGVLEACAPEPVTNSDFTRALADKLNRPAFMTVPRFALTLVFGGAGKVMLASQRVEPRRTQAMGYRFIHETLESALSELADPQGVNISDPQALPQHEYVSKRGARHRLVQETMLDAPLDEVFPFFERPENLGPLTPPQLSFDIQGKLPEDMKAGAVIRYRIRLGPIPMGWETHILRHDHNIGFVDAQTRGPYRSWYHEHRFEAVGDRTRMVDEVHYSAPFGPIGLIANWLFVAPQLRRIFAFRSRAIRTRFGTAAAS